MIFQTMYQMGPEQERPLDMLDRPYLEVSQDSLAQQMAMDALQGTESPGHETAAQEEIRNAVREVVVGLTECAHPDEGIIPLGGNAFESGTGWTDLTALDPVDPEAELEEIIAAARKAVADAQIEILPIL